MYGEDDMRIVYADALARRADVPDASFDLLVANPPYSVRGFLATLSEEDRNRYELSGAVPSGSLESFNGIETFFVERAAQLLKPCGIAAVILPSSILSNGAAAYLRCRDILLRVFDVVAIAEFGSGTFGKTGTNTVTLFLRKKDAPPDFAAHCANRADAWLAAKHGGDEVFQDAAALDRYCAKRGFSPTDYRAFLAADAPERVPPAILTHDAVRALLADFAKRTARQKWTDAERAAEGLKFLRAEERERLRVFLLADANPVPVLLVKMPADTKEAKAFLGYEWSARKGNEGIKYLGAADAKGVAGRSGDTPDGDDDAIARNRGIEAIRTPLFDNAHLANEETEKLNSLVRKNFRAAITAGTENAAPVPAIPESLRAFARTVPLVDLLDFDAATFDRQIRSGATASAAPVRSKFPMVRLGEFVEPIGGLWSGKKEPFKKVSVIRNTNFTMTGDLVLNNVAELDVEEGTYLKRQLVPGDIIVEKSGGSETQAVGRVVIFRETSGDWSFSNFTTRLRVTKPELIPEYIHRVLHEYWRAGRTLPLQRGASGLKNLDLDQYLSLSIPLPPLAVQQKVVDACAAVDAECAAAEKIIADGKAKIAEIMARVKGPGRKLETLLQKVQGDVTKIPEKQIRESGKIPVVTQEKDRLVAGFTDGVPPIADLPLIVFGDHTCAVKYVDFPFVRGADGTQLLKVDSQIVLPRFLSEWLKSAKIENAEKYERHFKYLKSMTIPLPPLAEQEKIVAAVEAEEAAITAEKEVLAAAPTRKAAILANCGVIEAQG